MGFSHIPQWKRHKAALMVTPSVMGTKASILCTYCRIELPASIVPGTVVLSKEDRLYIGDDPRAQDCRV